MVLLALADLKLLSFTTGLAGPFIFPVLVFCFACNYLAARIICLKIRRRVHGSLEDEGQGLREDGEANPEDSKGNQDEPPESFHVVGAMCATWLPSVVGHESERLFLVLGVTSLLTKVFSLGLFVVLAGSGLQAHVYQRPFMIFCVEENSRLLNQSGIARCKYSEGNCFSTPNRELETKIKNAHTDFREAAINYERFLKSSTQEITNQGQQHIKDFVEEALNFTGTTLSDISDLEAKIDNTFHAVEKGEIQQKLRVCEDPSTELFFRLGVGAAILVVVLLAAVATYKLHKISDFLVNSKSI